MTNRCAWCLNDPLYTAYHDEEWGVPVHNDLKHFEFILLESAQAGLSWITILRKRENYRKAFDGFNPAQIAAYDGTKIEELMGNPGIIRNRRKIEATIQNAKTFLEVQKEFGSFDRYAWGFVGGKPVRNNWPTIKEVPAVTPQAEAMSKDMKKRGFRFFGPTICYAYMQAVGMVNDHPMDCFRHNIE
jgi:DNA-3-methyladenine glycosylase I